MKQLPAAARTDTGFTLVEIVVVVVVLGLLAGLVAPQIIGRVSDAKEATARTQIDMLSVALDSYRLDNGRYPTTSQGLDALRTAPTSEPLPTNWRGPYVRRAVPMDPWDHPYEYRSPGDENPAAYDVFTLGLDGAPGGEGEDTDITNWQ
jgi:general secretion pathway protein G